jgi:AcrR family transcriptional regulator
VYYYFPTKDDLFFAVVEELYGKLLRDLEQAIAPDVPVRQRVERVYLRLARLDEAELLMLRLVAREALTSGTRFARLRERFQTGHIPLIARLVADGYASGAFDPKLHPMVAMLCMAGVGVVPQLATRLLAGHLPFPDAPSGEALAKVLVAALFAGTGAPGAK